MKLELPIMCRSTVHKQMAGAIVGFTALSAMWSGTAFADPAQDTVAKLKELSQQAEQLTETMRAAQQDLDKKLELLSQADQRSAEDLAKLANATAQLAIGQNAVDKVAVAVYVGGGRADGLDAILTAPSPKILIDKLAVQRAIATEMTGRLQSFRRVSEDAQAIATASARSEAEAQAATDEAVAVRAKLLNKQSELRTEIVAVNASYALLPNATPAGALPSTVMAALGLTAPIPTVGMGGLVPNARSLAAYIMATYPGVQSIGGVRSDPLPDHPSGHAIDIMIGSDMGLGDAINADVQSRAGQFGVAYTMWRVASHFNHVHITVS